MITLLFLGSAVFLGAAYVWQGRRLERRFDVDDRRPTPSHTLQDGVDYVPSHPAVLFGHHFSSIAGAGPIVGPILAALAFGWAPALLWILAGAVWIGGVHDFAALIASVRHGGRSIAQLARESMSPLAFRLLLLFIWLTLVYVLTVFADLTAATFEGDGGVATSSFLFIGLAVLFGLSLYRLKVPLWLASLMFVPLVFLSVWAGQLLPLDPAAAAAAIGLTGKQFWSLLLIAYCLAAAVLPVWILLQPRDYLSSFLLYASLLGGLAGILAGGFAVRYPAFTGWSDPKLGPLFPILFITIACGACSGFHAMVASGTTAKQLKCERDARRVGFGAMLVEGLVAVIALLIVAMLPAGAPQTGQPPLAIYGYGMAQFLGRFGVPETLGASFGILALSTFILTTLDTATRLGRYVLEEFFGTSGLASRLLATAATLALPALLVLVTLKDAAGNPIPAYQAVWPVFGATNQMLAGLALLVVLVWMKRAGRPALFLAAPLLFMLVMTIWALVILIGQYRLSLIGIIALLLLALAVTLLVEAGRTFKAAGRPAAKS